MSSNEQKRNLSFFFFWNALWKKKKKVVLYLASVTRHSCTYSLTVVYLYVWSGDSFDMRKPSQRCPPPHRNTVQNITCQVSNGVRSTSRGTKATLSSPLPFGHSFRVLVCLDKKKNNVYLVHLCNACTSHQVLALWRWCKYRIPVDLPKSRELLTLFHLTTPLCAVPLLHWNAKQYWRPLLSFLMLDYRTHPFLRYTNKLQCRFWPRSFSWTFSSSGGMDIQS